MSKTEKETKELTVKQGSETKKSEGGQRLPNKPLYYLAAGVLKPYVKLRYRVKFDTSATQNIKGPYVVLANHCSTLDWIYVATAFVPDTLNFVVTTYHFTKPGLRFLLRQEGCIAKDQFSPDVRAVKAMIKTAKLGGSIMVFPEGRTTPSGASETFERSTIKLLKHLKNPVIALKMNGSYLTNPKWSTITRKGKVELKSELLFTSEQLSELSEDELYERMCAALRTDEYAWQDKNRVRYVSKHFAKGLENVLWQCPRCRAEFRMQTEDNAIVCGACGNRVAVNEYYDLIPDEGSECPANIAEWFDWEVDGVRRHIAEDSGACMREHMELQQIIDLKKWLQPVGQGEGTMDKEGFRFTGERLGQPFELFVPIAALPAAAVGPGKSFELYYQGEFYSFHPDDPVTSQKWSVFIEQMHNSVCGGE